MNQGTSRTLLNRVRDPQDRAAWEEFYALYAPLLQAFSRAHGLTLGDAQEVRDQCLAVVVRKMPTFEYDRARGGFKGFLYRIAKGKIVDLLRKQPPRRAETRELGALCDSRPGPDQVWEREWRSEHLRFGLEQARTLVSERNYQAFELLLIEGLSVAEVGERLGMNANQVYKAKSRVLVQVRRILERVGCDDLSPLG